MSFVRVRNASTQRDFGRRIRLANNVLTRARGLIARSKLKEGEGILMKPCQALRMTRFTQKVDVIMVGPDDKILALYPSLEPGEKTSWHARARYAVEVPPGTIAQTDTRIGDEVTWTREKSAFSWLRPGSKAESHPMETAQ
jgi:uncharacterized protein